MYNDVPQFDDQHDNVVWEDRRGSAYDEDQSKTAGLKDNQAVALYTFEGDQPGDLAFKKGDIITVTKKTDKAED